MYVGEREKEREVLRDQHLRSALAEVYEGALALKIGRFNRTTNTGAACT